MRHLYDHSHVAVIASVQERLNSITHGPPCASHSGSRRLYTILRRNYWPAPVCHEKANSCPACARERINLRRVSTLLKVFRRLHPSKALH